MINEAIYELYPSAKLIEKMDGVYSVYDGLRNPIVIDMSAVEQEAQVLEAQARAKEEAMEAVRARTMLKLVENAGLTIEEVRTFLKIDGDQEQDQEQEEE